MLITCGNCGGDVSDKASRCPACRAFVAPLAISCPECAKDIDRKDLESECPHCGYPLRHLLQESSVSSPSPQAQAPAPPPKGGRLRSCLVRALTSIAVVALLLGAAFALLKYDAFGMRTSLRKAVDSEETSESAGEGRLWVKHFLSMLLDAIEAQPKDFTKETTRETSSSDILAEQGKQTHAE